MSRSIEISLVGNKGGRKRAIGTPREIARFFVRNGHRKWKRDKQYVQGRLSREELEQSADDA